MKLSVIALLLVGFIFSCSPTETTTKESETDTEEPVDESTPAWYNNSVSSEADSVAFTGYALAVAADSVEAHQQSMELATENLKFSIDEFAEEIRVSLTDEGITDYESPGFIINLRNSVRNMEFSTLDETVEHVQENNTHMIYTRVRFAREDAINQLRSDINNDAFIEAMGR
ncbi:MAG: hypothetical protein WEA58_05985 [Balneolaceae bacterium]